MSTFLAEAWNVAYWIAVFVVGAVGLYLLAVLAVCLLGAVAIGAMELGTAVMDWWDRRRWEKRNGYRR